MKFKREKLKLLNKNIFNILILFSLILTSSFVIIDSYFFSNDFKEMSLNNGIKQIREKEKYLQNFIDKSSIQLSTIKNTSAFNKFKRTNNPDLLTELFMYIANTDQNIMEIRYIDKNGFEKIRVDRKVFDSPPIVISEDNFQNKANRDYFYKSKEKNSDKTWFSKLDLNLDNHKIEIPHKVTLRAILAIKKENEFDGILIINYYMNHFFDTFLYNNLYKSILVDEDGYALLHYDEDKSWGKYKTPQVNIIANNTLYNKKIYSKEIVKTDTFISKQLDVSIENKLVLILNLNQEFLLEEKHNKIISKLSISILIFLFSIILILIISRIFKKVMITLTNYDEYVNLIDENIITSTTDINGKIVFASKAFCRISGYEEKELLGKSHSIVKHPDETSKKYKELWAYLKSNKIWEGEFKNISKKGTDYWVQAKIYPIYDLKHKKIGYTAIRHDITDKKIIEQISITDGLTNIFNRKHFDSIMPKVLNGAKRNDDLISFVMVDIDYFKKFNDTYGHHKGDLALKCVAQVLKTAMKRSNDYAFRLGGEEFALTFISNSSKDAISFTKKLCLDIENLHIEHLGNDVSKYLTVSLGLICKKAKDINNYEELYQQADELLYQSKNSGRNQVTTN